MYAENADALTFVIFVRLDVVSEAVYPAVPDETPARPEWCIAGTTSFLAFRPDDLVIEIGNVAICPRFQRTPVNTAATHALLQYAFESLGCLRVEWKCNNRNEPSRRAALRLGFTFEGVFRQHMIVKEAFSRDTAWFSMLASEWPERNAALVAFLGSPGAADLFRRRAREVEMAGFPPIQVVKCCVEQS